MTPEQVQAIADELDTYATHFAPRDWNYTRDLGALREIRYDHPYERIWQRVKRAVGCLWWWRASGSRLLVAYYMLHRDRNRPDGVLDGGSIITHWEETGEYLQYVQPTVGALIADWLRAEPENPHARLVAGEMRRIQDAYAARLGKAPDSDESVEPRKEMS